MSLAVEGPQPLDFESRSEFVQPGHGRINPVIVTTLHRLQPIILGEEPSQEQKEWIKKLQCVRGFDLIEVMKFEKNRVTMLMHLPDDQPTGWSYSVTETLGLPFEVDILWQSADAYPAQSQRADDMDILVEPGQSASFVRTKLKEQCARRRNSKISLKEAL